MKVGDSNPMTVCICVFKNFVGYGDVMLQLYSSVGSDARGGVEDLGRAQRAQNDD